LKTKRNILCGVPQSDCKYAIYAGNTLVKCNKGHESDYRFWDCPVCTEKLQQELDEARAEVERLKNQVEYYKKPKELRDYEDNLRKQ